MSRRRHSSPSGKMGSMKKFVTFVLIPCIIIGAASYFFGVYMKNNGVGSTESGYQFILDHINHKGELVDIKDEICVKSIEDIKFFLTEKKAVIEFGYIRLEWTPEDFVAKETRDKLERIGIEMRRDKKTNKLLLLYHEEEIQRWVS